MLKRDDPLRAAAILGLLLAHVSPVSGAQSATSPDDLYSIVRTIDEMCLSGMTLSGSFSGPSRYHETIHPVQLNSSWSLTAGDGTLVLEQTLDTPPEYNYDNAPEALGGGNESYRVESDVETAIHYESASFSAGGRLLSPVRVERDGSAQRGWGNQAGMIGYYYPGVGEDRMFYNPLILASGHGFTREIDRFDSVTDAGGGLLEAVGSNAQGDIWKFIIEPSSGYVVREAAYYPAGKTDTPPIFRVVTEGAQWFGELCIPTDGEWIDNQFFATPDGAPTDDNTFRFRYESGSLTFDQGFAERTKSTLENAPLLGVPTTVMDKRSNPPTVYSVEPSGITEMHPPSGGADHATTEDVPLGEGESPMASNSEARAGATASRDSEPPLRADLRRSGINWVLLAALLVPLLYFAFRFGLHKRARG